MKIGIIGNGFVGKATSLLASDKNEILVYDVDPAKCVPNGLTIAGLGDCAVVFVCVPTPMKHDGSCYTGIVERVLNDCNVLKTPSIVVRSTVPIGFCKRHKVHFMPEFLTEKNWEQDFIESPQWIVGVNGDNDASRFVNVMVEIIQSSNVKFKDDIRFCTTQEAEMTKYFRNCFLATKVAFCNEMEEFCSKRGISYNNVRDLAVLDKRIGASHTSVPGHDGKRGFGGTCLPKDLNSMVSQCQSSGIIPVLLFGVLNHNEDLDRTEKDWLLLEGRATIERVEKCNMCGKEIGDDAHFCV